MCFQKIIFNLFIFDIYFDMHVRLYEYILRFYVKCEIIDENLCNVNV
jgi:hypothetical protein